MYGILIYFYFKILQELTDRPLLLGLWLVMASLKKLNHKVSILYHTWITTIRTTSSTCFNKVITIWSLGRVVPMSWTYIFFASTGSSQRMYPCSCFCRHLSRLKCRNVPVNVYNLVIRCYVAHCYVEPGNR